MLQNYLKIALRNARRHRLYSLINILGLTMALTGALFLLLYVTDELSYDKHHAHAGRIYRIAMDTNIEGTEMELARSPDALGTYLQQTYPEIDGYAKFKKYPRSPVKMKKENKFIEQPDVYVANPGIFEVFSYRFLQGNPSTALSQPNSIVITQTMAKKYFGNDVNNVIGKTIISEEDPVYGSEYSVTGLIEDVIQNSHFKPAAFLSYIKKSEPAWHFGSYTYIKLQPGIQPSKFEKKIQVVLSEKLAPLLGEVGGGSINPVLQPLTEIHFYSRRLGELQANSGNMNYIYTFSLIAIFLIILAVINYINLATARGQQRAKEVGIRKAFGAIHRQLMGQFLTESFLFVFLAVLFSILLIYLLSPIFLYFSGKNLTLHIFTQPVYLLWVTALLLILTLLAGGYPAFFLSRFRPVRVLKSSMTAYGQDNVVFRKMLVVAQFTISLVIIMSTLVVFSQLRYWNAQELGFDKEQIVKVNFGRAPHSIKDALLQYPEIVNIGVTNTPPGTEPSLAFIKTATGQEMTFQSIDADYGFISTLGIPLIEGRNFRDNIVYSNDIVREHAGVLVNESLVKQMGWTNEEAIGKTFTLLGGDWKEEIIGVVKDFHITSLHDAIEPMIIQYGVGNNYMLIKISGNNIPETLDFIQNTWNEITGTSEVAYTFLDQHFQ